MAIEAIDMVSTEVELPTEEAPEPLPRWLTADDEQGPPVALRVLYEEAQVPPEVVHVCEQARRALRETYVRSVLDVHQVLAPLGLFKAWCEAAGINYRTAQSIVARAEQGEHQRQDPEEQASETATRDPSLADADGPPEDEEEDDDDQGEQQPTDRRRQDTSHGRTIRKWELLFKPGEYNAFLDEVGRIKAAEGIKTNKQLVLFLVRYYTETKSGTTPSAGAATGGQP